MSTHTATTLAYVRTLAGVVKVVAGEDVPTDVLPSEVDRLSAAGVLVVVPAPAADQHSPAFGELPPAPKLTGKAALIARAEALGLDTTGTKAELTARIAAAR